MSAGRQVPDLMGDDVLHEARALGDPTRFAIFRYLLAAPGAVGVRELTDHFGLNHNAIRQHLAKLRDTDLVREDREPPRGRGRPALRYQPSPGAAARWAGVSPYEQLSGLLLRIVQGEAVVDVGLDYGRALAATAAEDPFDALEEVSRRLGFAPRWQVTPTGRELVLDNCPFASAATRAPDVVCQLHRWIAEGLARCSDGDVHVTNLVVRPPRRAGCLIQLGPAAATT